MANGQMDNPINEQSQQQVVEGIQDVFKGYQKLRRINPKQDVSFVVQYLENIFEDVEGDDEDEQVELSILGKIKRIYESFKILSPRLKADEATAILIENLAIIFGTGSKPETSTTTTNKGFSGSSQKIDVICSTPNNFDTSPGKNTRSQTSCMNQKGKAQESQKSSGSSSATLVIKLNRKEEELKNTLSSPSKKKPFICSYCSKGFSLKGNLKIHENKHTKKVIYECQYCRRNFSTKYQLDNHVRVHTGEKPFSCKHCHKKFSTLGNCTTHEKSHARQAQFPFKCDFCPRGFNRQDTLDKHLLDHHSE